MNQNPSNPDKARLSYWLCLGFVWAGIMLGSGSAPASQALEDSFEMVTKVVRQYALTSANDFPQRDPQDWRLLGSNDGGNTWTTLDVRKREIFSERHQRRLFQLTNTVPYNVYRLQIDKVRDPSSANSVHLAEIEPLGATEDDLDPIPSREDLITVRGENPPLESRFQAFDSQAETKWLDFADKNPTNRSSWIQWQYVWQPSLVITNVRQLLGLRARAADGYPVRIAGVLVNRLSETNVLCFLDPTGYLEIPGGDDTRFSPGQRLLLQGTSQWTNKQVGVGMRHITPQGQQVPTEPRQLGLDEPLDEQMQWVEAEGSVQFCTWPENHLAFELTDGTNCLSVQVLHLEPEGTRNLSGARVRVRGICSASFDLKGQKVPGTLWVPSLAAITILAEKVSTNTLANPEATAANNSVVTNIVQLRQMSQEQLGSAPRVNVRGVITEVFGGYLQDQTGGIELWLDPPPQAPDFPSLGTSVEVTGTGEWITGRGAVIRVQKIVNLGKSRLPTPKRPTWRELSTGKVANQWIEMEGVVRSTDGSHMLVICEGGQLMATIRYAPVSVIKNLVDATVRLRGLNISASDEQGRTQGIQLLIPSLEYVEIEHASEDPFNLPTTPIGSLSQVTGSKESMHRVKVEGILTFGQNRKLFLQDASGAAMAIGREDVVLDVLSNWAFYQKANEKGKSEEDWDFKVGDRLEVVGFPETRDGYAPVLTEALARKVGQSAPVTPAEATVNDAALGKLDSTLVSMPARVMAQEKLGNELVLELQSGQKTFQAVMPLARNERSPIATGSRVRVTGVCQVEPSPFPELGKRFASFKLLVTSPASVTILLCPSWWTLTRALTMAGGLAVILALAGAWIAILRRQVEVRTKQLKAEIEEHKETEGMLAVKTTLLQQEIEERKAIYAELEEKKALLEKEIEERKRIEAEVEEGHRKLVRTSRQAGMAEVATSVLHNVGNVLNSANMLVSLIGEHLRNSKVPTLLKAVGLMKEHNADLGPFLTQDERGRHLPVLLEQLAEHLAEERARVQAKVGALNESVQHIKGVVTMQQKYAKVSTPTETVLLSEVVEDALRLSGGALARHDVRVVREYKDVPNVTVDRNQVLQILFNLLENARHACVEDGRPNRQVTIEIRPEGDMHVQIRVIDNGSGISSENLSRIFAQGFSTRKSGHGFGLHSSILAAQDMGGSLTAQSDGPGRGAIFTLEFPISAVTA